MHTVPVGILNRFLIEIAKIEKLDGKAFSLQIFFRLEAINSKNKSFFLVL